MFAFAMALSLRHNGTMVKMAHLGGCSTLSTIKVDLEYCDTKYWVRSARRKFVTRLHQMTLTKLCGSVNERLCTLNALALAPHARLVLKTCPYREKALINTHNVPQM